ncbi:MAG: hypothetical protein F4213_03245 [Boseongicola sp. SB0677_bin_26]|nr:hypothetical protein [Boseongicola sp. SB0665_bin_10]MYG25030.1 hypothetical protein [Boseongicola sp. SB0677_bin_26]
MTNLEFAAFVFSLGLTLLMIAICFSMAPYWRKGVASHIAEAKAEWGRAWKIFVVVYWIFMAAFLVLVCAGIWWNTHDEDLLVMWTALAFWVPYWTVLAAVFAGMLRDR